MPARAAASATSASREPDPVIPVTGTTPPLAPTRGSVRELGYFLIQRQGFHRYAAHVAGQLIAFIGVLAARHDTQQSLTRATQLEGEPAHICFTAVSGAYMGAFDIAQAPLGLGAAVELLAG